MTDPLQIKRARCGLCPECGFWPSQHDRSCCESPDTCNRERPQVLARIDEIMREAR